MLPCLESMSKKYLVIYVIYIVFIFVIMMEDYETRVSVSTF